MYEAITNKMSVEAVIARLDAEFDGEPAMLVTDTGFVLNITGARFLSDGDHNLYDLISHGGMDCLFD